MSEDIDGKDGTQGSDGLDGLDGSEPTDVSVWSKQLSNAKPIALILNKISKRHFTDEWISSLNIDVKSDESLEIDDKNRINSLQSIVERVVEYYREVLGIESIPEKVLPNIVRLVTEDDIEEFGRLLRFVLNCAVDDADKELIIKAVADLNDQHLSSFVMNCLQNCTQIDSSDCLDTINTNNNLSEEETINSINNVFNETNVEKTLNSMISLSDIKAKESFAQQMSDNRSDTMSNDMSNNDLRNELNKNHLFEENRNRNQKYQLMAERMVSMNTGVNIVDSNQSSNGLLNEEVVRLQNHIDYVENENHKMRETTENYILQINHLRDELKHYRTSHSDMGTGVWNREAMTGICEREFLYKLIISQLLYDGHRNLAITLSTTEKFKNLVPPSERLHHLIAIALKAEGDSPLSDDSIHPMNLIDLDFEADRTSGSSRASLYEHSGTFRGRSFSPDNDVVVGMQSRMLDMGRIISKTSPIVDPMHNLTHVQSNDSIASRSTPDMAMPSFGQPINANGLRAMTPNEEMSGQSSILGTGGQQLDLSDLITQINLAQLVYMNPNPDPSGSVASSSANTPSPTPLTPSVPLENGGLVLNEAALKNISQLAKMSVSGENGLVQTTSSSPTSLSSTLGRSSSTSGSKPNVMQIRCKFGQLGQQKGQFSSPHGFCLGVDEEIVIADTNNHRICIFDKSADFKHSFGVPGKDEAQLWYPRKVAIIRTPTGAGGNTAPRYVICDRGAERSRMQIFTRSGHFVRKIAIRYIDIVAGLAITPNGHIVAVDSVSPTVFVIAETGDLLRWFDCSEYMREPSDIAISNNEYYICDFKGHCVVVFNEEGQYMRKIGCEGLTSFPNGIDISDAGDILVGDSHGNRFHVVVFDRSGTLVSEFECPYVKVSRCCGLKITSEGYVVTLAKNNHHVLVLNTLYIM